MGEIRAIDLVEADEVAGIGQPHLTVDHVGQRAAGGGERLLDMTERGAELRVKRHVPVAGAILEHVAGGVEGAVAGIEQPRAIG